MNQEPLVSIIIPTYNRAHLIGETLDSIIAQTYTHWECIVVDDGSTDATSSLMNAYIAKDKRFKYHHRPKDRLPGGNAARNYGFELSKGDFIQWFDSDDIMVAEKLELKVTILIKKNVDFVISQTNYFNKENAVHYPYNFKEEQINFLTYSTSHISWFTPDIFIKREIASKISFNEYLKAGQEYNFSCKLLLETNSCKKIDKVLTLRRFHLNSIGRKRQLNKKHYTQTVFDLHWNNLLELKQKYAIPLDFEKYSLLKCMKSYIDNGDIKIENKFHKVIFDFYGIKGIYFYLALISNNLFKRYHFFYKKLR